MRAVLDTNILIDYLNGIHQAKEELDKYSHPVISVITWMEIMVGAKSDKESDQLHSFMEKFRVEDIDDMVSFEAVKIRRSTKKKLPDAIIEATAIANETILVTRNSKDFSKNLPYIRIPYQL